MAGGNRWTRGAVLGWPALAAAAWACFGCGSAEISPTANPSGPSTPAPPTGPPLVRLTPAGVDPQLTHVFTGRVVVFVNEDAVDRAVFSDPHPGHSQCRGGLNLGRLAPGTRREVELEPGVCVFHGEEEPGRSALGGMIVVH